MLINSERQKSLEDVTIYWDISWLLHFAILRDKLGIKCTVILLKAWGTVKMKLRFVTDQIDGNICEKLGRAVGLKSAKVSEEHVDYICRIGEQS
jgi:hypothetical protein